MIDLENPFSKHEVLEALKRESAAVAEFFQSIPEDKFFQAPQGIWSPADNLVHLIKSVSPIGRALGVPKTALRLRFGKAKHKSRSLAEVRAAYMVFVDAGTAIAPATYEPQMREKTQAERVTIFAKWQQKNESLAAGITGWSEEDLDFYQLPHPLIGNLTVREMLLFTLYHNMHHVNDVSRLLERQEVEWFKSKSQNQ